MLKIRFRFKKERKALRKGVGDLQPDDTLEYGEERRPRKTQARSMSSRGAKRGLEVWSC